MVGGFLTDGGGAEDGVEGKKAAGGDGGGIAVGLEGHGADYGGLADQKGTGVEDGLSIGIRAIEAVVDEGLGKEIRWDDLDGDRAVATGEEKALGEDVIGEVIVKINGGRTAEAGTGARRIGDAGGGVDKVAVFGK